MSKDFIGIKGRRWELNGVDMSNILEITIDDMKPVEEAFDVMNDNNTRHIELTEFANGTIKTKAMYREYSNDNAELFDLLALALGHSKYDTTNEVVTLSKDGLDAEDETNTTVACPPRLIEVRQVESTASQSISFDSDSGDDNEQALAQQFIAGGEDITGIKLKIYDNADSKVESFDMEIWSDDGNNKPNTKLSGTNTITVNCSTGTDDATNDYIGALTSGTSYADATWEYIDMTNDTPNIMGTASLTIGTKYWLVIRNVQTRALGGGDDLFVNYTTNNNYEGGVALGDDDVRNTPAWGDAASGTKDLTFIIEFKTDDGLQIDIYDYIDPSDSSKGGIHYTFKKVKTFSDQNVACSPKKVTEHTLKWASNDVTIAKIN